MALEVVRPRIRGFICTNAHPAGCAAAARDQIARTQAMGTRTDGGNVLVVGASTGYGLASRIVAAFGFGAKTVGVFYERPPDDTRTASAGYYNSVAFHRAAAEAGLYARSINGDAFSDAIKTETIGAIRSDLGAVSAVVYSLAAPRRLHPRTGATHNSVLKPIGQAYTSKSLDLNTGDVVEATFPPATGQEIEDTVAVMGGEDLAMWVDALLDAGALAPGARVVAFSYIGPELTHAIYRSGTIGKAKEHLEETVRDLAGRLRDAVGGSAYVSVNKAVVTQASAAIPVVPLYISLLYPIMKERGTHEDPVDQMNRLFRTHIAAGRTPAVDEEGRIRLDDGELDPAVQAELSARWKRVSSENIRAIADVEGFQQDFRRLFGFAVPNVDYDSPTEINLALE
jgi:enoyl-[acyl-carrier protein] reductase/trans-2-enoyl-CoA reductase (NAD+)